MTPGKADWPPYSGEYVLGSTSSDVAVLIIGRGDVSVPEHLFQIKGIMKTENVGLEKVVLNIVSNPSIRRLVVCGKEEFGHFPADAIINLHRNGVDPEKRVIDCRSAIPFLCSLPPEAIERFRAQLELVDLVHPKDSDEIVAMDPIYHFEQERTDELVRCLERLKDVKVGPYPAEGLTINVPGLRQAGDALGRSLHKTADVYIEGMLRLPSEALSTRSATVTVDEEFGVALDPVSGNVFLVPNVELAARMRAYFTGC
ncbi:MAG TPA: hypothetical protein VLH13_03030 [Methanomassiliicoccales archaeon]|nr:hypothetical protein [Methanomassiliicoccales archaeon]